MWIKWSGLILFYLNGLKAPKQPVGKNWVTLAISDSVSTVLALCQRNHDGFYLLPWITSGGPKRVWPMCSATSSLAPWRAHPCPLSLGMTGMLNRGAAEGGLAAAAGPTAFPDGAVGCPRGLSPPRHPAFSTVARCCWDVHGLTAVSPVVTVHGHGLKHCPGHAATWAQKQGWLCSSVSLASC